MFKRKLVLLGAFSFAVDAEDFLAVHARVFARAPTVESRCSVSYAQSGTTGANVKNTSHGHGAGELLDDGEKEDETWRRVAPQTHTYIHTHTWQKNGGLLCTERVRNWTATASPWTVSC